MYRFQALVLFSRVSISRTLDPSPTVRASEDLHTIYVCWEAAHPGRGEKINWLDH